MSGRSVVTADFTPRDSTPEESITFGIKYISKEWGDFTRYFERKSVHLGELLVTLEENCKKTGRNFTDLFPKNSNDRGRGKLPFGYSTGYRLMSIAKNSAIYDRYSRSCNIDVSHEKHRLPADWNSLYELSRVPAPMLEKLINDGRVQAGMDRREVRQLVAEVKPTATRKKAAKKKAAKCEDVSRSRAIDPRRVVEDVVNGLSGTMLTLSMFNINLSSINASKDELDHWTAELTAGIAGLRKLNVELNRLAAAAALQERGR